MIQWKKLSYERKKMLHHATMMLVAKEGKAKGLLNFDGKSWLCPKDTTFTVTVSEGVTGTVSLRNHGDDNWVHASVSFPTVCVVGYLQLVDGKPKLDWMCQAYSEGGIPNAIIDMALTPIEMDEVLA